MRHRSLLLLLLAGTAPAAWIACGDDSDSSGGPITGPIVDGNAGGGDGPSDDGRTDAGDAGDADDKCTPNTTEAFTFCPPASQCSAGPSVCCVVPGGEIVCTTDAASCVQAFECDDSTGCGANKCCLSSPLSPSSASFPGCGGVVDLSFAGSKSTCKPSCAQDDILVCDTAGASCTPPNGGAGTCKPVAVAYPGGTPVKNWLLCVPMK